MPSSLARTGVAVFAMLFALTLVTERPAAGRGLVAPGSSLDPSGRSIELPAIREIAPVIVAAAVAGYETAVSAVVAAPVLGDSAILTSWYGPGFYGNRTASGQTYTAEILGVAHLTLPCALC